MPVRAIPVLVAFCNAEAGLKDVVRNCLC